MTATATTTEAIYRLGLEAGDYASSAADVASANDKIVTSAEGVTVAEEKIQRATRTTADGFARLEARYDPIIRAEQRRQAAIAQATRYLDEGSVGQDRYAQQVGRVNAHYDEQIKKLRQGSQAANDNAQSAGVLAGAWGRVQGALIGALGLGAMIQFGRNVLATVGDMGDLADQVGLTAEQLQVYQFHAVQAGLKTEQFEQGIAKFTRTVGAAAKGEDAAIKGFNDLGVGINGATGKLRANNDILLDVAKAIAAIEDPQRRAAAAADIFGDKVGQKMLPVLMEMARGWDENARAAREAGVVIENEVLARFDKIADGMAIRAKKTVVFTATVFDELKQAIGADLDFIERRWNEVMGQAAVAVAGRGRRAAEIATGDERAFEGRRGAALSARPALPAGAGSALGTATFNPPSESDLKREAALAKYLRGLEDAAALEAAVGVQKEQARALTEAENKLLDDKGVKLRDLTAAERERVLATVEAGAANRQNLALEKSIDEQERAIRDTVIGVGIEYDVQRAIIAAQNKLLDEQGNRLRDLTEIERDRVANAVRQKDKLDKEQAQAKASYDEMANFADRAFDRIGTAATQMFVEGKGAAFEWKNLMKGVISEIMQEFIKLSMLNPLKNALFGGTAPTLGSVAGGGGLGGLFGSFQADTGLFYGGGADFMGASGGGFLFADGGVMTARGPVPLRKYAGGGVARTPQLAMFGEGSTPEAYVPVPSGRIPVEMRGPANDRGVVVNQTVTIDARGADPSILPRINAALARNKDETVALVYGLMRKGGKASRAAGLRG